MKKKHLTPTRAYSFLVPACVDGMLGFVQTAIPLLALRFGATALFLGILGGLPQMIRFPFCLTSGHLSDKIGRTKVIFPAILVLMASCLALSHVQYKWQLLVAYTFVMAAIGAFYPALQAFIGDHSGQGELRKNLGFFNAGWATGGATTAVMAGFVFAVWRALPFYLGVILLLIVLGLVAAWSRVPKVLHSTQEEIAPSTPVGLNPLLLVARLGHFLGFFSFSAVRNVFPKLGAGLGMSEGMIGLVVGCMLVGQALGMILMSLGTWWRGKIWPIVMAQTILALVGMGIFFARSIELLVAATLLLGMAQVIPYTCSLYYSLQSRTEMGKNTGIHEALVAAATVTGSLIAGTTAQYISLRAPYAAISIVALLAVAASLIYWNRRAGIYTDGQDGKDGVA